MTTAERLAAIREHLDRGDYPQAMMDSAAKPAPEIAWLLGIAEAAEKMAADVRDELGVAFYSPRLSDALSAYDAASEEKKDG